MYLRSTLLHICSNLLVILYIRCLKIMNLCSSFVSSEFRFRKYNSVERIFAHHVANNVISASILNILELTLHKKDAKRTHNGVVIEICQHTFNLANY